MCANHALNSDLAALQMALWAKRDSDWDAAVDYSSAALTAFDREGSMNQEERNARQLLVEFFSRAGRDDSALCGIGRISERIGQYTRFKHRPTHLSQREIRKSGSRSGLLLRFQDCSWCSEFMAMRCAMYAVCRIKQFARIACWTPDFRGAVQ